MLVWDRVVLGVVLVYLGLIAAFLGGASFLRPLSFLAIRTRRQAVLVLVLGLMAVVMGGSLPASVVRVATQRTRSEEHTSELQSRLHLVCPLLLEKKNTRTSRYSSLVSPSS